jgi:hypothetical protein
MTFVYFLWIGSGAETGAEASRFSCAFAARLKSCPSKPITFPQRLESCPDTKELSQMAYFQWILSGNSKSAFILPYRIRTVPKTWGERKTPVKPTSRWR